MRLRCVVAGLCVALVASAGVFACGRLPGRPLESELVTVWRERTERARGLALPGPVPARWLARKEVPGLLEDELAAGMPATELETLGWAYGALGLLPPEIDLRRTLLDFAAAGVDGFYSPRLEALFLVEAAGSAPSAAAGSEVPPRLRDPTLLVHELAHALQAAHSRLDEATLGLREHGDLAFALGAFLEGDALWTAFRHLELEHWAPLPHPETLAREMEQAWSGPEWQEVPRAVREPLVLQYPLGYALVHPLAQEGGTDALNAALARPPLSSEQLLHPERYGDPTEAPRFLELPQLELPGCALRHRDTLGELGVRLWLAERRGPGSAVERPADGWEGDRLAVWDCDGAAALAWVLRFESPAEARELAVVAEDAVGGMDAGLRAPPRVEVAGSRLLISAGLEPAARERVLSETKERRYADLAAFLAAHPEVLQRARRLRRR